MMNRYLSPIIIFLFSLHAFAQPLFYISPTGSDTNPGSIEQPFLTVSKGLDAVGEGGLIYLREGVYSLSSATLKLSHMGLENRAIKIWAYPGEKPVFDCSGNASDGISITGNYYHLKGIEQKNAGHYGIFILGNHNTVENCTFHDNKHTGFQVGGGTAKPSDNLILHCDSYRNYDPPTHGEDADGFGMKKMIGSGNVLKGCRAFSNSDDGFDLWMAIESIMIDSCYAFRNGVNIWGDTDFQGNGNGFKVGGRFVATPHILRNCVAFDNAGDTGKGFDENNNPGGQTLLNCTSFRNKGPNFYFNNTVPAGQTHSIKNCLSYKGEVVVSSGIQECNSWQGFTLSDSDFVSLDTSLATIPRNADGRLSETNLFRLKLTSPLVNAGVNVHLPYFGKAPDIGAFETKE
jgi:hypothetical protein